MSSRKKAIAIIAITATLCMAVACIAGCGSGSSSSSANASSSLSTDEIASLYEDSSSFKGKTITVSGQVYSQPNLGDGTKSFNMYQDPANRGNITAVTYEGTDLSLVGEEYVTVTGTVGAPEQKVDDQGNVFEIVTIAATSVTLTDYKTAVEPTLSERSVNMTVDKDGYSITIDKIEFAADETRVYFSAVNNADATFGLRTYNATITQSGIKYDQAYNKIAEYAQPDLQLDSGESTEAILTFPPMDYDAEIVLLTDATTGPDQDVQTYEFDIS